MESSRCERSLPAPSLWQQHRTSTLLRSSNRRLASCHPHGHQRENETASRPGCGDVAVRSAKATH
eukprot:3816269-Rhodomonas_salina.1